jgi:hypothetical protein
VGFYEWMLALHVLAAFAMGASLVLFALLVLSSRRVATIDDAALNFRLGGFGGILIAIGSVLALILGIVLAIDSDDYQPWDGWVVAAIVMWAVLGALGGRTGRYYTETQRLAEQEGKADEALARLRAPTGAILNGTTIVVFVLILLDMLFKPGA